MRPIVHTFGTFLVERAFEQVKLGFGHQGVGGVLVGVGRLVRRLARPGRTHQAPGDVALMDTLPGGGDPCPRHRWPRPTRSSAGRSRGEGLHYVRVVEQTNADSFAGAGLHVVRRGSGATVVALGPVLDEVLEATADRDVTVLYAHCVRPFDARTLRSVLTTPGRRAGRAVAGRHLGPLRGRRAASTCPIGCSRWAPAVPSCVTTAPPRSTSAPTASTPPASAAPSTSFLRCVIRAAPR